MKATVALLLGGIVVGCTAPVVRDADLRIFDRNVLGATYVVCASDIKWDGVTFTIENLEAGTVTSAPKSFSLGKLSLQPTQIRQLNTIALGVDGMFRQMCQSTVALRKQPQALASYVVERDKTALKLFALLRDMERANLEENDASVALKKQQKLFDSAAGKQD